MNTESRNQGRHIVEWAGQLGVLLATASAIALAAGAAPAIAAETQIAQGAPETPSPQSAPETESPQTAPDTKGSQRVEKVVVTSTRRKTTTHNVPGNVTAITGDYLDKNGMDTFKDYAGQVPSLDFVEFAPGRTRITIRGVSADPGIGRAASTTSVYLDDVPVTAANPGLQIDFRLYDVNRVEVLRGPQGTLFGENSMGGAIRIFTNNPDPTELFASYEGGIASIEGGGMAYKADAMVNIPLVQDELALRVVGSYRDSDGWVDNITTGEKDVNSHEIWTGRAALAYTPTDDFSVTARVSINRVDVNSLSEALVGSNSITNTLANSPSRDNYEIYNGQVHWNLGFASLESITGYVHRDDTIGQSEAPVSVANQNFLFTIACVFGDLATGCSTLDPAAAPITSSIFTGHTDEGIFTQEIHLVSPDDQRLRWIVGAFYRSSGTDAQTFRTTKPVIKFANSAYLPLGFSAGDAVPGGFLADMGREESEHYAGFVEASFDITPTVEVTTGLRSFHESFDFLPTTTEGLLAFFGSGFTTFSTVSLPFSSDASDTNYKAVLSWKPDATQHYYTSYSEGFRSGGANGLPPPGSTTFTQEFRPDTTKNYEVGAKWILDDKIYLTTAAFYTDWQDLQVNDFDLSSGTGFVRNGGAAHVEGVELELFGQLTDELSFTAGGNLARARTDTDIIGSFVPIIFAGARLPNVPEWGYGGSVQYVTPLPDWNVDGVIRFNVHGQGHSFSALERFPETFGGFPLSPKRSLQEAYHIGNIRVGVERANWSAFIYVDNIWNEVADLGDNNFGMFHRNQPRTVGFVFNGNL